MSEMSPEKAIVPDFLEWFQEWILRSGDRKPTPEVSGRINGIRPHLVLIDEIHNEKGIEMDFEKFYPSNEETTENKPTQYSSPPRTLFDVPVVRSPEEENLRKTRNEAIRESLEDD